MNIRRSVLTFVLMFALVIVVTGGSASLFIQRFLLPTKSTTTTGNKNENGMMRKLLSTATTSSSSGIPSPTDPTYSEWCLSLEGTSIYTLGSKLNCPDNSEAFSMGLMVAVFFTVCIEVGIHTLEHHITNYVTLEILNKVYRELMMMGFISFGVGVLESIHFFELLFTVLNDSVVSTHETPHAITERRVKIFELVHICLFVLSIIYVIAVVISYFVCRVTWQRWSKFEVMDRADRTIIERSYHQVKDRFKKSNIFLKMFNISLLYKYSACIEMYSYYCTKQRFLTVNKLPRNFRFDIYLKTRIRKLFLNLIDLGVEIWATVFIVAMINYGRGKTLNFHTTGGGLWSFFGALGMGPLFVCFIVYLFTRVGYSIYQRQNTMSKNLVNIAVDSGLNSGLLDNAVTANNEVMEEQVSNPTHDTLAEIEYDVDMTRYFVFHQPRIIFFIMQGILLSHSFYIAMLIIHFLNVALNEGVITTNLTSVNIIVFLALFIPSLLVLFVLFPFTIAPFTIMTSVDNFTSHKTIMYSIQRAEALVTRAAINKAMHEHSHYHPLRKQMKEMLSEHYPVLSEHGDFHEEPYFVALSNKENEQRKRLRNLIFYWNKRTKMLQEAKERAKRRQTLAPLSPEETSGGVIVNEELISPEPLHSAPELELASQVELLNMTVEEEFYDDDDDDAMQRVN